jgi:2-phosphoglycerate kinase
MPSPSQLHARDVLLIGGPPTAGKTTVARALSADMNIPWISTDQIRRLMRAAVQREASPNLYGAPVESPEQHFVDYSADDLAELAFRESLAVWPGIRRFVEADHLWTEGFIVEGMNILPSLAAADFREAPRVKAIFLFPASLADIREVIATRALAGPAAAYPDSVKDAEAAWVERYSSRLRRDASDAGFPCLTTVRSAQGLETLVLSLTAYFGDP